MKKYITLFLFFALLAFSLVSCGNSNKLKVHYFDTNAKAQTLEYACDKDWKLTADSITKLTALMNNQDTTTIPGTITVASGDNAGTYTYNGFAKLKTGDYKSISDAVYSDTKFETLEATNMILVMAGSVKDYENIYITYTKSTD